jgi:hypothetical protein
MRGWAQVQRIWARGRHGKTSKSALARGKDMEGVLNQYGTTVQTIKTLNATPTTRELAFVAATSRWQLAISSIL